MKIKTHDEITSKKANRKNWICSHTSTPGLSRTHTRATYVNTNRFELGCKRERCCCCSTCIRRHISTNRLLSMANAMAIVECEWMCCACIAWHRISGHVRMRRHINKRKIFRSTMNEWTKSARENVASVHVFETFLTVTRLSILSRSLLPFSLPQRIRLCEWPRLRIEKKVQCTRHHDWQTDEEKSYDIFVWMCARYSYTRPLNAHTPTGFCEHAADTVFVVCRPSHSMPSHIVCVVDTHSHTHTFLGWLEIHSVFRVQTAWNVKCWNHVANIHDCVSVYL